MHCIFVLVNDEMFVTAFVLLQYVFRTEAYTRQCGKCGFYLVRQSWQDIHRVGLPASIHFYTLQCIKIKYLNICVVSPFTGAAVLLFADSPCSLVAQPAAHRHPCYFCSWKDSDF